MRKLLASLLTLVCLTAILAGCSTPPEGQPAECETYDGVIVLVGVHANQPAPNVPAALACSIRNTIAAGGAVGVVANDGDPFMIRSATPSNVQGNNDATTENNVTSAYNAVIRDIQGAVPQAAGSDLFAALVLAADLAHTAKPPIEKVVVIDAGLPDTGAIDLTVPGGTLVSAEQLVAHLVTEGDLREDLFHDLDIEFWSLSYVSDPQLPLAQSQVNNIATLWPAIALAGGAASSIAVPVPREGESVVTDLRTGLVEVIEPVDLDLSTGDLMTFDSTSALGFASGESTLLDEGAARAALEPVAAWLKADPHRTAVITGRTDSEQPEFNGPLSLARGTTVADLIVSLGASRESLTVIGAAYTAQPPDRFEDGTLDPYAAALNRVTEIELVG